MKILVITNLLPHYQIDFFNRLVELYPEIDLTVVADIKYPGSLNSYNKDECNFSVVHNRMLEFKGLIFRRNILKIISENPSDRTIFYANPREITLTFVMVLLKIQGFPFYAHGMFHRIGGQRFVSNLYYKLVGGLADKLFIYSRKGADVLLNLGVKNNKINIIGTAINERKSQAYLAQILPDKVKQIKKKYNLDGKNIILQVVRLSKIKKPELIVDVAYLLAQERKDFVFVLIGDGEQYEHMRRKIINFGLDESVIMLGSIYDELELAHWFSMAKLFVIPTCIGLSAHHAFSYGLPVVTDDNLLEQASEYDILYDGLNSVIYKSGDIGSFKDSISKIMNDASLQSFLSRNAIYTVNKINSLDAKCKRYFYSCVRS